MLKPLLFVLGWLFFVLGFIGAFLPILPTTPFLLVAAACFSKSSKRFYGWLMGLPVLGEGLRDWKQSKVIRPRAKVLCLSLMAVSLYFIWSRARPELWIKTSVTGLMIGVAVFVVTRRSKPLLGILVALLICSGCSTPTYLAKQGWYQWRLQRNGVPNEELLADSKVKEEVKFKIRLVEDAKGFFSHYFTHQSGGIYSKTTMLDDKAVTWLVVASRPDEVKAHEFHFPFAGDFPYLGFFKKDDAEDFAQGLRGEGLVTWLRPVYAYSTLGLLEDRILSSFFHYDEVELAELVFHELFHTVFFAKDEVELNENLATYFSSHLLDDYFKDQDNLKAFRREEAKDQAFRRKLVGLALMLRGEFDKMRPRLNAEAANAHARRFIHEILLPVIREACHQNNWEEDDCPDDEEKWNQARLAALLTYEEEQDFIADLAAKYAPTSLKDFLAILKGWYTDWEKEKTKEDFSSYLRKKL